MGEWKAFVEKVASDKVADQADLGAALPSVLIAIELDLGHGAGTATLSVAPWETSSDFDAIVESFVGKHRIKPIFASTLVQYLEEVEAQAVSFPAIVKADLSDLYSRYG